MSLLRSRPARPRFNGAALAFLFVVSVTPRHAAAQTTFDFETPDQLGASALVDGDLANYIQTTEQAQSGTQSLRFDYSTPDAYQSWTYDMPFAIDAGTVSVWFYDTIGPDATFDKLGGSIILEEVANPGNFLAVEIWNAPYPASGDPSPGAPNYYITRGNTAGATNFNSRYFGDRSIGFHEVVFTLSASGSSVTVDGIENANGAGVINGPATTSPLRLRFMAWSASNGGFGNWTTDASPVENIGIGVSYIYLDDLTVTATTPAADTRTEGFEIEMSTATYDTPNEFMGPPEHDNPYMKNVVPQWTINTAATFVHSGTQSLSFTNEDPVLKSVSFDLTMADPGTITFGLHDLLGPDVGFDKVGGSVIIEETANPGNFVAFEVWNAPYPVSGDPSPGAPNYYATRGYAGNPATDFSSRYYGDRTTGWNTVEIILTPTTSRIRVNGIENADGMGLFEGPGLASGIRLRLMADSPSCGGFTNYTTVDELKYLYLRKTVPYLYVDDLSLPVAAPAAATGWMLFE